MIIANPNAPTGMNLPLSAIEEVAASNPDRVVMVDEAYVDFGGESCVSLLPKYENLVIIQTFSKSRSLGRRARRICDRKPGNLSRIMNRIKYSFNPYNVNRLSILAGAAAMRDWDYTKECTGRICKTREKNDRGAPHLDLLCWIRRPTSFLPRAAICREKSILTDCARQESW